MKYKYSILGIFLVLSIVLVCVVIAQHRPVSERDYKNLSGELTLPKTTKVILNISTLVDTSVDLNPSYFSKNYYYDASGTELGSFQIDDEMLNDYMVEGSTWMTYFFKHFTMLSNQKEHMLKDQATDVNLLEVKTGAAKTRYIKDKNLCYAYFNIGVVEGEYRSVIRFVSEKQNYDVIVPYFLLDLVYDEQQQQIVCFLGKSNEALPEKTFGYYILKFNHELQQFEPEERLHLIPYFTQHEPNHYDLNPPSVLVKNNIAYMVSEYPSAEYFNSPDSEKDVYQFEVRLLLTKST